METRQILVKENKHVYIVWRQATPQVVNSNASHGEDLLRWYRSCWYTEQSPRKLGHHWKTMFISVHHSKASSAGCNCGSVIKRSTLLLESLSSSVAMPSRRQCCLLLLILLCWSFLLHLFTRRGHLLHLLTKNALSL